MRPLGGPGTRRDQARPGRRGSPGGPRRRCLVAFVAAVALVVAGSCAWSWLVEPGLLTLTRLEVRLPGLPPGLEGVRIALLSDLHGASFGEAQSGIRALLAAEAPAAVVFAGDLVDVHRGGLAAGLDLLEGLAAIGPTFVVWGNHDYLSDLVAIREACGAVVGLVELDETWASLELPGGTIVLAGQTRSWSANRTDPTGLIASAGREAPPGSPVIVVMHSPGTEQVRACVAAGAGLVLAGHTHGGQIRLPLIGALWAPGQGILPRRAWGRHEVSPSGWLVVTRGLGTSVWPLRFLCPPEVMLLTLRRAEGGD